MHGVNAHKSSNVHFRIFSYNHCTCIMQEVIKPDHYANTFFNLELNYVPLSTLRLYYSLIKDYILEIECRVTLDWRFMFQELVSEKLRTQQMNNDLEKLTHELEKIGLNKERLLQDKQSFDNDR